MVYRLATHSICDTALGPTTHHLGPTKRHNGNEIINEHNQCERLGGDARHGDHARARVCFELKWCVAGALLDGAAAAAIGGARSDLGASLLTLRV